MITQLAPVRPRSRWLALVVLCAGMLMIILDQTIVTVALPAIQQELGFTPSGLAWVVNAYVIPFGGLLLLAGRLGDLLGRKRVFVAGLIVFTAASILCGIAATPELLIAARFAQGIGGAITSAVVLGMIVPLFPEPRERARAIGIYAFVGSAGATIGFFAGGLLTQALNWHWIFFVNAPIGVIAAVLAVRIFPAERGLGLAAGADALGALLVTAGLMLGVYTIVATDAHGWGSAHTLGFGAASIALLVAFLARQATAASPLLPLRVFRSRNVSGANIIQGLMVAGLLGWQFLNTLYLQQVLGYSPVEAGLAVVPAALAIGTLSLGFSARLNTRFGTRTVLLAGLALVAAGLVLVSRAPLDAVYLIDILPGVTIFGAGGGLALPAITTLAMSDATGDDAGLVSGLTNTTQSIGSALGLAVLATVAATRTGTLLDRGVPEPAALTSGYRLAFSISVVLVGIGIVIAATVLRSPRRTTPTLTPTREPVPA